MFLIDFFVLNSVSASLKNTGSFVKTRSKVNFKVKMKLGTSAIPHFHVILTGQYIFKIIWKIQSHFQGQKVNFKVI